MGFIDWNGEMSPISVDLVSCGGNNEMVDDECDSGNEVNLFSRLLYWKSN